MERANITWPIAQAVAMYNNGTINIDVDAQRKKYQWTVGQASDLIHSAIEDYYIPALVAWREETGEKRKGTKSTKIYKLLDGGQRMRTFVKFFADEFAITGIPEVSFFSNAVGEIIQYDANGKKYSELPKELQDVISNTRLSVTYLDDCSQEEAAIAFRKLNNGKALSSSDRNIAYCGCLTTIKRLADHEFFAKTLSASGKENRKQYTTTMKIWAMLNKSQPSFESKEMNKLMISAEITPEEEAEVEAVLDVLNEVYDVFDELFDKKVASVLKRKVKSETHTVSLAPFAKIVSESEAEDKIEQFAWFIHDFYGEGKETSSNDSYNTACAGGSAKAVNISRRNTALLEAWDKFTAENANDPEEETSEEEETFEEDDFESEELAFA